MKMMMTTSRSAERERRRIEEERKTDEDRLGCVCCLMKDVATDHKQLQETSLQMSADHLVGWTKSRTVNQFFDPMKIIETRSTMVRSCWACPSKFTTDSSSS